MADYTIKGTKGGFVLSDEQQDIVAALVKNRHYFNCAQTGIGKTYSTLTAAIRVAIEQKDKNIHFVLLLPNSAVKAFRKALAKQLGIPFNIYTATHTRTMPGARFHIFNYNTLSDGLFVYDKKAKNYRKSGSNRYFDILYNLRKENKYVYLIADEAHALQDTKTMQYQLVKYIRPIFYGVWFLTATPILNHLEGHFNMVDLMVPGHYGNWWQFRARYCRLADVKIWVKTPFGPKQKKVQEIVGYKNLDLLQEQFAKISIIRAQFYDFDILYKQVKLPASMLRYYKYAAAGLLSGTTTKTGQIKKGKQDPGARLHDLQRVVSNSHAQYKFLEDPNKLTPKEVLLINTLKEIFARNEATLIYFGYHETIDRIRWILQKLQTTLNIGTIHEVTGKIKKKTREAVEDNIMPNDVVLITSAGTESVNLQKANNLIFYETPFPIREFIQGCGRITRTDSLFEKFRIYVLEAAGTIDTYKKNRIIANSGLIRAVVGGSNILPTEILELSAADKQAMKDKLLWGK